MCTCVRVCACACVCVRAADDGGAGRGRIIHEPRAQWRANFTHRKEYLPAGETGAPPTAASLLSPRPETQFAASMNHIAERAARASAHVDIEQVVDAAGSGDYGDESSTSTLLN